MNNEELERAVERLNALATDLDYAAMPTKPDVVTLCGSYAADARDNLRALLSERAELLAAVERMRGALDGINELARDRLALIPADLVHGGVVGELLLEILARAALTTGEGK